MFPLVDTIVILTCIPLTNIKLDEVGSINQKPSLSGLESQACIVWTQVHENKALLMQTGLSLCA
jgi:hypothetical protein